MSLATEIGRAAQALGLAPHEFLALPEAGAQAIRATVLAAFAPTVHGRWWWEGLQGTSRAAPDGGGWRLLSVIAPDPDERVWFIAEGQESRGWFVFDTTVARASMVLGECYGFEYCVVAKNLSWLVCENHHSVVIAVGALVESRLAAYAPN
jgi:hypothetical protein